MGIYPESPEAIEFATLATHKDQAILSLATYPSSVTLVLDRACLLALARCVGEALAALEQKEVSCEATQAVAAP